ncbi:MAG: DOPA 4,5-dioxygenase family protein [Cyanobacteria bacterium P01_A01_bin.3]
MTKQPTNTYDRYHAHVYFDATSLQQASSLCGRAGEALGVKVGHLHQKRVGPHPCWSCQLAFDKTQFDSVIRWLDDNREDLSIFVHGLSGDDLHDHTDGASWLGAAVPLNLSVFGG